MILSLSIISIICYSISLLLNLLLLFLLFFRPSTQLKGFKWISVSFIITDLVFSLAYTIIVPLWHADSSGLALLIPVGFISSLPSSHFLNALIRPAYMMWHAGMISTSFLVAATFTYRYNIICNSKLLGSFFSLRFSHFIIIGVVVLSAISHGLLLDAFTSPLPSLSKTLNERIGSIYDVDFTQVYYQGVDRSDSSQSDRSMMGMAESGVFNLIFLAMAIVVLMTGTRMYSAIKKSSYSRKARERQMHLFKMIVAQAVSPLCFLYIPPIVDASSVTFNYVLPYSICFFKALLVFMFPIVNPLIILIFTQDYRRYIFRLSNRVESYSLSHISNRKGASMISVTSKVTPM